MSGTVANGRQVVKLFDMMDKQLTRVREKFPGEQVVRSPHLSCYPS